MYNAIAAPIPDAPSTIKNKGIIKLKKRKREVGFLSTNKRMGITTV